MGLKGWYPFIRRQGYEPVVLHLSALSSSSSTNGRRRLDVLGACYKVIRNSYMNNTQEVANLILEKEIGRFGSVTEMTLYIDGYQAAEKSDTAVVRQRQREKARERTAVCLDTIQYRMDNRLRLRKRHFTDVRSGLSSSFHWSLESREDFARHMASKGWTIRNVETEADLAIAIDAQPGDIVISADSDMLAYASVRTLWRPVSKGVILSYIIPDLLQMLGITRPQLTALAIVTHNDYNKNIPTLGPATNFSIIKSINSEDPKTAVAQYMQDSRVVTKNEQNRTFELSIRVFIDLQQTSLASDVSPPTPQNTFNQLFERFQHLCSQYEESKCTKKGQKASAIPNEIIRLQVPRSVNSFRTVESPKQSSKDSKSPPPLPPPPPPQPANTNQRAAHSTQDVEAHSTQGVEGEGHPPLTRTRIPRHRLRYSFKKRKGNVSHEPPAKAKQYAWKPPKETPKSAKDPSAISGEAEENETSKAKKSEQASSSAAVATYVDKDKKSLVFSLGRCHPTSSLEVGTLDANTKRVFSDDPDIQKEVVTCIKEATRDAVDVKREAQRLIGQFLEKLRVRIDAEVAKARYKKKSGERLSESERLKARWDALSCREREILVYLAGEVEPRKEGNDEDDIEESQDDAGGEDSEGDDSKCARFLQSFMVYLYSRNLPKKTTKIGGAVYDFISILADMDLLNITRTRGELNRIMPFTPTNLVRSVTTQLVVELKKMYQHGSHLLHDK
ncbi:hypothetical protein EC991_008549, partial [Linnemannia zychae]